MKPDQAEHRVGAMGDGATVVMALATVAGACLAHPLAPWPGPVLALLGLRLRRPLLLILGTALAASAFGARAEAGLQWSPTGRYDGWATLVGDPGVVYGAVRADVRIGERRLEAWARGSAGRRLGERLSGERVQVTGQLTPVPVAARSRLASRHVAGRLSISSVGGWQSGSRPSRFANGLRRTLLGGARSLPPDQFGLFGGFVLGDDRGQPVEVVEDFRAAGLSHLLVVSGQNVLFVLALAGPVLRRLGLGTRLAAAIGVIVLFGVLTRWEPSVLRAVAMAAVSLTAVTLGRPVSRLRVLALAVTVVILVDPLLVRSLGFALSVSACAGIALLAAPIASRVRGPAALRQAVGLTLAAQAGVAPILVPIFGGVPVVSLPANLLAVPASGLIMMWGMSAGLVAGLAGEPVAALLHGPTRLLVGWTATVARIAGGWNAGQVGSRHLLAAALTVVPVLAAGAVSTRGRTDRVEALRRWSTWAAAVGIGSLVVLPAAGARWPPAASGIQVVPGARLWRDGGAAVLVLDGVSGPPARLLAALRSASVHRLDVVVAVRPGATDARVLAPLLRRSPPRLLLAPPGSRMADAVVAEPGTRVDAGPLAIWVDEVSPRLAVRVGRPP